MNALNEQLRTELINSGAALAGFADLQGLPDDQRSGFNIGISIAVAVDPAIINGLGNGPTREYYEEYVRLNKLLDSLDIKAAEIIKDNGFNALPKTRANVGTDNGNHSTVLPHKTVATRAGLGWIGKCALLVTEKYGSAVRISSVLTDAPLIAGTPFNSSKCGSCDNCVRNCPAEALSGALWSVDKKREMFYDTLACRKKAVERNWRVSPGESLCGLCVLVCPRTKNYITSSGIEYNFPPVDMAAKGDLEEILSLQKLAFQSEALLCEDYNIPPLTQTLEELKKESERSIILKVTEDRKIIGSARAFEKDGTCYIGRVIVHPGYQNKGIGKKLMGAIEKCFRGLRYELFTGNMSERNLAFYEKLGYKRFKIEKKSDALQLVYLEK